MNPNDNADSIDILYLREGKKSEFNDLIDFIQKRIVESLGLPSYMLGLFDSASAAGLSLRGTSGPPYPFERSSLSHEFDRMRVVLFPQECIQEDFNNGIKRAVLWGKYPKFTKAQIRKIIGRGKLRIESTPCYGPSILKSWSKAEKEKIEKIISHGGVDAGKQSLE